MDEDFKRRKPECMNIDPDDMYGSLGDYFCLKIHHGGRLVGKVTRVYVDGSVDIIDMVEGGNLSIQTLRKMVLFLGNGRYNQDERLYFHFRIPGANLTSGLHHLQSNVDIDKLVSFTSFNRCIAVYVEHGISTFPDTFLSLGKVVCDPTPPNISSDPPVLVIDEQGVSHPIHVSPEYNRSRDKFMNKRCLDFGNMDTVDEWITQTVSNNSQGEVVALGSGSSSSVRKDCTIDVGEDDEEDTLGKSYLGDDEGVEKLVQVDINQINSDDESDKFYFDTVVDDAVEWYDKAHKGKEKLNDLDKPCELEDLDFDELSSIKGDGSSDDISNKGPSNPRNPQFNKKRDMVKPKFFLLQEFASKKELKDAIEQHSIETRRELKFIKNDKTRLRAVCKGIVPGAEVHDKKEKKSMQDCPWTLHASQLPDDTTWQIKTYVEDHWCLQTRLVKACTYKFLAEGLTEEVRRNPGIPVGALKENLEEKYQVHVSRMKAFRAKSKAHNLVIGSFKEQYELLRDYCMEVIRTNPGSTMKIDTEPEPNPHIDTRVFRRIYCCLGPLKKGFQAGCRPVLGLDGTFIKGPYPGQLLAAVGIDANNGLYPLAWALVEVENMRSWEWFLECLGDDLDIHANSNFCFMSDRQKGLIPALAKLFPDAEHRYCLKHIWDNFRLHFKGLAYKDLLWSAASATNVPYYEKAMDELKKLDPKAYEWLSQINPCHWSKSHFSLFPRSDILYNNLCETFNSKVLDARDKPIITCLENIRLYVNKRIVTVRKEIDKCKGVLCPKIEGMFEVTKKKASELRAVWHGGARYQVSGPFGDQVVVDLNNKSCTCRRWDLTALPCKHAVRAIWCNVENGGDSLPENWVDDCYKVETWKKIYEFDIHPIAGVSHWKHSSWPSKLLPPVHHVQPGRPKKARRRSQDEIASQSQPSQTFSQPHSEEQSSTKKSRKGGSVHCQKCGNPGHNSRTCKGQRASDIQRRRGRGRGRGNLDSASGSGSGVARRNNSQPSGSASFNNGSTYRVNESGPSRAPIFGARGAMFWLGTKKKP